MVLTELLKPEWIICPLKGTTKPAAIAELVDRLAALGVISQAGPALEAVLAREKARTTGVGNGLAIPHGKTASAPSLVMAIGKADPPIDFESVDAKPVNLVILLLSPPDKAGPHIQALARISRLMCQQKFLDDARSARSPEELYQVLKTHELALP